MADDVKFSKKGQIALTSSELSILKDLVDAGDRGAFHYVYAKMSDNDDALLTTKIATFSDTVGGIAFAANWYLQQMYDGNYGDSNRINPPPSAAGLGGGGWKLRRDGLGAATARRRRKAGCLEAGGVTPGKPWRGHDADNAGFLATASGG